MRLLFTLFSFSCIVLTQGLNNVISLRPKPKARAGGADAAGAQVFSFAYVAPFVIYPLDSFFTLSLSVLTKDIWIMHPNCTNCKSTFIQYSFSSPSKQETGQVVKFHHSDLNIDAEGTYIKDSVRILNETDIVYPVAVASKFVDVYGLALDGILGLGNDNTSIIYKLYEDKQLDQPIYSLSYLNDPLLILGTPDFLSLSLVVESQQTVAFNKPLEITKFGFRDKIVEKPTALELSSISSYITGPADILESIFKILVEEGCHYEEELLMCECENDEYPTFNFTLQQQEFFLTSHEYLIQLGDNCFLALKSGDHWILGEPLFKGYFTEFNLQTGELTLYKTSALTTELPSPFETTEGWAAMISLGIGSIAIYVVAFLIYLKYEEYKKARVKVEMKELAHLKPRIL